MKRLLFGGWLLGLAAGVGAQTVPACPTPSSADQARLQSYVAKQYNLAAGTPLAQVSSALLEGSCMRRVTFAAEWPELSVTVVVSPDGRYVFPGAVDLEHPPAGGGLPAALRTPAQPRPAPAPTAPVSKEQFDEMAAGDPAAAGPASAAVTIVEFSDFECPFCQRLAATLTSGILPAHRDVRLVFRYFPLPAHPWAEAGAEMAECARRQSPGAFWELHDFLFEHQATITTATLRSQSDAVLSKAEKFDLGQFHACLDSHAAAARVAADVALGKKAGVHATPTFFVNGEREMGALAAPQLEQIIERARAAAAAPAGGPRP